MGIRIKMRLKEVYEKISRRLVVEVVIIVVVFAVSLNYSLNRGLTYLVADCSDCDGECISYVTLKSGVVSSNYDLNLFIESEVREYSYGIFSANFSSCSKTNPEDFEEDWKVGLDYMDIQTSTRRDKFNFSDSNIESITMESSNCFVLTCKVENMAGYGHLAGNLIVPNKTENHMRIFGQLLIQKTNVIATCYVNINDILFTFLSTSNSFTQSDVYKCKTNNDLIVALGVSLTYVLTSLSIIKFIHYFHKLYNSYNP